MITADNKSILVVDDEEDLRNSMDKVLRKEGYRVLQAEGGKAALELLRREKVDVVVSDLRMPEIDGVELLRLVKKEVPEVEVILLTAYGTIESAVEAMREGAYDFITKPFKRVTILKTIEKALEKQSLFLENKYLREQLQHSHRYQEMVGTSQAIREVLAMVERVAPITSTVLITGESGTGKELVARAIHNRSPRRNARFVPINCGAFPENLIESELFGHTRGAFTGAMRDKEGLFKTASGGTLFLDEIGNVPINLQSKLLRAIEEKEFLPVGSTKPVKVDIRIIAASNRDLAHGVEAGNFRGDLFYRINVVGIDIPPLRERREDIPPLVEHFVARHNLELGKRVKGVDVETMGILLNYTWKGNVRELDNVIERAMILCDEEWIRRHHLPPNLSSLWPSGLGNIQRNSLREVVKEFEKKHILDMLEKMGHDKQKTAEALGLSQSSLYRKMAELEIPA